MTSKQHLKNIQQNLNENLLFVLLINMI